MSLRVHYPRSENDVTTEARRHGVSKSESLKQIHPNNIRISFTTLAASSKKLFSTLCLRVSVVKMSSDFRKPATGGELWGWCQADEHDLA